MLLLTTGFILAILAGFSMGVIGGGGSILTVPILVYVFNINPVVATFYSFFIVAISSFIGGLSYLKKQLVCYKSFFVFGIPSIITVLITRKFIISSIPATVFEFNSFSLSKEAFIMIVFGIVMLTASIPMIRKPSRNGEKLSKSMDKYRNFFTIMGGIFIGFLSGLLGMGGGFLIIPALLLFTRMNMKMAIGTSLMIITSNATIGFIASFSHETGINWWFLILFTFFSIVGIFSGIKISKIISGYKLKPIFGWFVLSIAIVIISNYFIHFLN